MCGRGSLILSVRGITQELGEILVLTCVRYNFSPTDYTDNTDSFFFFSMRSLTASNALYGFTQIFALRHFFF